jgi:hypothetical protein
MFLNINQLVKVKLTDFGRLVLAKQSVKLTEYHYEKTNQHKFFAPKSEDRYGYAEFSLGELISTFGDTINSTDEMPFDANINFLLPNAPSSYISPIYLDSISSGFKHLIVFKCNDLIQLISKFSVPVFRAYEIDNNLSNSYMSAAFVPVSRIDSTVLLLTQVDGSAHIEMQISSVNHSKVDYDNILTKFEIPQHAIVWSEYLDTSSEVNTYLAAIHALNDFDPTEFT